MNLNIPEHILSITPYQPGKPLDELKRETDARRTIKLASNENPLGPSPLALKAIEHTLNRIHRYPDSRGYELTEKLSARLGVEPRQIVLGNGSDDIIAMLTRALLKPGDEAIAAKPSFLMYDIAVRCSGAELIEVPLKNLGIDLKGYEKRITPKTRLIFICNPNNPTGVAVAKQDFKRFFSEIPGDIVMVIDEAYIEFVRDKQALNGMEYFCGDRPIVILRTFSKAYGLAGLRVGYGVMPALISDLLHRVRGPFNVNILGQAAAAAALDDEAFLNRTLRLTHEGLDFLYSSLDKLGVRYFPTQTNFFLIDVQKDADMVYEDLLSLGVIVRSMSAYDFPTFIRVNVGLPEENSFFIEALQKVLS
ncbi:MAG: histidinol-phosphate transaminase [Deltaproteobacteria bacterium]|nr:histidinol-phosphate transaminase [Deltaproteobacteria bacterium]